MRADETNRVGQEFGLLRVLRLVSQGSQGGNKIWECLCQCGNKVLRSHKSLINWGTKSCGCLLPENRPAVKVGDRFFKLEVLERVEDADGYGHSMWKCRCDCGNEIIRPGSDIRRMKTCGCNKQRTGMSETPEYSTWTSMLNRCHNKKHTSYERYGRRGIRVCMRWRKDFFAFLEDMGPKPSPEHMIERIDNNWHYNPENCCWATPKQQQRNKRNTRWLTFNGETMSIADWADKLRVSSSSLWARVRLGWSDEEILSIPVKKRRKQQAMAFAN